MQLVSFLGYLIGKETDEENRYFIISRDSDFVNTVSFWQDNFGNNRVEQYPSIESVLYFMSEAKEEEAVSEETTAAETGLPAKSLLNNAIQTALSKNRVEGNKIPAIASMVVAFCKEENHKEVIMECLVRKYGSKDAYQLFTIIAAGLLIHQQGADPGYYLIAPAFAMTLEEYTYLLNMVVLIPAY